MGKLTAAHIFVFVSLLLVISLPVYTVFYIYPHVTRIILDDAERDATEVASHLATMFIPEKQQVIATPAADLAKVDQKIRNEFNIKKIKMFTAAGEIVFSSDSDDIGKLNNNDYFFNVVAQGRLFTKLVSKDTASLEGQIVKADVVETYVPIMRNGAFIGAFEIYYDITARKQNLDKLLSRIYLLLSPFAIFLVVAVILSSLQVARNIRMRQQIEKTLQVSEASFQELFNSMSSGITVYEAHDNGAGFVIVDLNKAAEVIDKVNKNDIIGRSVVDQFAGAGEYGLVDAMRRVHESGNSEYHPITVFEDDRIQNWREHYIFKLPSGRIVVIYDDLTKRKQVGHEVQVSMERLRRSLAGTIQAMAMTVEARDPFTAGHQRRVADLARSIAQEMQFDDEQVDAVRLAGLLHDLGKISVPAEILSKPGRLSDLEFDLVKEHPKAGYEILQEIEFAGPVAEIIRQHHERLDGSGYPHGLHGNEILLQAKVLAVADVVEAMLSHRPYRPAHSLSEVLDEIQRHSGILYDSSVVDACVKLFTERRFEFKESLETGPVDDNY